MNSSGAHVLHRGAGQPNPRRCATLPPVPYYVLVYEQLPSGAQGSLLGRHGPIAKSETASWEANEIEAEATRRGKPVIVSVSER